MSCLKRLERVDYSLHSTQAVPGFGCICFRPQWGGNALKGGPVLVSGLRSSAHPFLVTVVEVLNLYAAHQPAHFRPSKQSSPGAGPGRWVSRRRTGLL